VWFFPIAACWLVCGGACGLWSAFLLAWRTSPRHATPAVVAQNPSATHHAHYFPNVAFRRHHHHSRRCATGSAAFRPASERHDGHGWAVRAATAVDAWPGVAAAATRTSSGWAAPLPTPVLPQGGRRRPSPPRRGGRWFCSPRRRSGCAAAPRLTGARQGAGPRPKEKEMGAHAGVRRARPAAGASPTGVAVGAAATAAAAAGSVGQTPACYTAVSAKKNRAPCAFGACAPCRSGGRCPFMPCVSPTGGAPSSWKGHETGLADGTERSRCLVTTNCDSNMACDDRLNCPTRSCRSRGMIVIGRDSETCALNRVFLHSNCWASLPFASAPVRCLADAPVAEPTRAAAYDSLTAA